MTAQQSIDLPVGWVDSSFTDPAAPVPGGDVMPLATSLPPVPGGRPNCAASAPAQTEAATQTQCQ